MYEPKKNVNELTRQFEVKRAILWEIEYVNVHQRDWVALNFSNGIQSHVWYDWLLRLFAIFMVAFSMTNNFINWARSNAEYEHFEALSFRTRKATAENIREC